MAIPVAALLAGLAVFGLFLLTQGKSPVEFYGYVLQAGFGSAFSWQNTLSRTAPLLFAALCVALPARLGLVVIGAKVRSCWVASLRGPGRGAGHDQPCPRAAVDGGGRDGRGAVWIGAVGALRHWRGVNDTNRLSLLLSYIALR